MIYLREFIGNLHRHAPFAGELRYNEPLAPHTTLNLGGPADVWIRPDGSVFPEYAARLLSGAASAGAAAKSAAQSRAREKILPGRKISCMTVQPPLRFFEAGFCLLTGVRLTPKIRRAARPAGAGIFLTVCRDCLEITLARGTGRNPHGGPHLT